MHLFNNISEVAKYKIAVNIINKIQDSVNPIYTKFYKVLNILECVLCACVCVYVCARAI